MSAQPAVNIAIVISRRARAGLGDSCSRTVQTLASTQMLAIGLRTQMWPSRTKTKKTFTLRLISASESEVSPPSMQLVVQLPPKHVRGVMRCVQHVHGIPLSCVHAVTDNTVRNSDHQLIEFFDSQWRIVALCIVSSKQRHTLRHHSHT